MTLAWLGVPPAMLMGLEDGQAVFADGVDQANAIFVSNSGGVTDSFQHTAAVQESLGALLQDADARGDFQVLAVKSEILEARLPGVYAIGDVNIVPMANGWPLPKAGVFASDEGETVGHNIAAKLNGTEAAVPPGIDCFIPYNGTRTGMVQGRFLASGKPDVDMHPPSAEGFRAKEQFERGWRSFRF